MEVEANAAGTASSAGGAAEAASETLPVALRNPAPSLDCTCEATTAAASHGPPPSTGHTAAVVLSLALAGASAGGCAGEGRRDDAPVVGDEDADGGVEIANDGFVPAPFTTDGFGDPGEAVASPVATATAEACSSAVATGIQREVPRDSGSDSTQKLPADADGAVKAVTAPASLPLQLSQVTHALASVLASVNELFCGASLRPVVSAILQFIAASYAHQLARSVALALTAIVLLALPSPAQLLDQAVCSITAHAYLTWVRPASCSRLQWDSLPSVLLEESLDMLKAQHSGCWGGASGAPAVPQAYVWKAQLDACEAARAMLNVQLQHERVDLMTQLAQQAHDSGVTARVATAQRSRDHAQAAHDSVLEEQTACASKCWFGWRCSYTEQEQRTCPTAGSRVNAAAALLHLAEEELEAAQAHRKFYNLEDFERAALANLEASTTDSLLRIAAGPADEKRPIAFKLLARANARLGQLTGSASANAVSLQPADGGSSGDASGVTAGRAPMAIIAGALAKARTYEVTQLYKAAASDPEVLQYHVTAALEEVQAGLVVSHDDDPATSLAVTVARVTQVRSLNDHVGDNCEQLERNLRSVKLEAAGQTLARFKHAVDALATTHSEQHRAALKAWAEALHHRYLPVPRQPSLHLLQCLESTAGSCRPLNAAAVTVRVARVLSCSYGIADALETLQAMSYRFVAAFVTFLAVSLVLQPILEAGETYLQALNLARWWGRSAGIAVQLRASAQVVDSDAQE